MALCWSIWTARNKWLFKGKACDAKASVKYVTKLVAELQKEDQSIMVEGSTRHKWKPPQENWVKLNVDGGAAEGRGASVEAVVRDCYGEAKVAVAWRMEERWPHDIAEAMLVLLGLKATTEFGHRRVVVESDCLGLINAISSRERGTSSLHIILDDIYHVTRFFIDASWNFVHRDGNKVAYELAHCLQWDVGRYV
ncbi:uncharacterized protein LOC110713788 [Chenopodium quinoa]|uniref:uncharacterized protein LOC110713788 n=1 Tax=Chenopodium quinoa TaxID=63459 RepID=UPI000B785E8C|nr:uncharacterized protein LOC110713788 [Chenopodium quinoa]